MARQVHTLIAETAKEIAGAWYEQAASKDANFYRRFPNQRRFVASKWGSFVGEARQSLTAILGQKEYPENLKREIYEALINDRNIAPVGRPH